MATANASITLVISTLHGKPSELVGPATAPHESVNRLCDFLRGAVNGEQYAKIDAYSSTVAPAAASGTYTLTFASITAGTDTVTVGGVVLTSSTTTTSATTWKVITDAPTTATNLATCINTNTTLNPLVTAAAVGGVVTVTCNVKGTLGNLVGLATSNGTGAAASGTTLASGTGGPQGAATTYRHGL